MKTSAKVGWACVLLISVGILYQGNLLLESEAGRFQDKLGYHLVEAGHPQEALPRLREAVQLAPHDGDYHNNLGFALTLTGNLEEGEHECRLAVELEPTHSWCWDSLGQVLTRRGKYAEAVAVCTHAFGIAPLEEREVSLNSLGQALYLYGDRTKARQYWLDVKRSSTSEKERHRAELYLIRYP